MDAFATVGDLEARWRELDGGERERAEALLMDATALISSMRGFCAPEGDDELALANLTAVTCAVVRRAMDAGGGAYGVSQQSQTAGSFSESVTYTNPAGDLYLTKAERQRLGIGRLRVSFVGPWRGGGGDAR